jgi:hypothetical protein
LSVALYFVDVDPCSGAQTLRFNGFSNPQIFSAGVQPAGETIFREGPGNFNPNTRQMAFGQASGTITTKNGLLAGICYQPIWLFIAPEVLIFGEPMYPIGTSIIKIQKRFANMLKNLINSYT